MSSATSFGQWVKKQRKSRDLTQDDLAIRVGCGFETIRKIEAGSRRPSRQMAELLARTLGVSEEELPAFVDLARVGSAQLGATTPLEEHEAAPPPGYLPAQVTSFVGREQEVDTLATLLLREDTRLVTLVGPPGIGKTRLSMQVGELLRDRDAFPHGVYFVPLSPVSDPARVLPAVAQTLGLKEAAGQSTQEMLSEYLRDRRVLLVLDNFEQIISAGSQMSDLLAACPSLKVLVTSRSPLRIYGEQEYSVPSLSLAEPGTPLTAANARDYEAIELFVERAQAVDPSLALTNENATVIARICYELDGLPLAIELAAARCKVLTPQAILSRLSGRLWLLTGGPNDLPLRQQSLRAAIDWSYDLLSDAEKVVFRRMASFVGGGTLEALEAVCLLPGEKGLDILSIITSLLDKSLLRREADDEGESHFWMLWTVREYALERLQESGEAETLNRRHASYFTTLAENAEPVLMSPRRDPWLQRLNGELANIRGALTWSLSEAGDHALALRMAGALHWFWYFRGYLSEGRDWLEKALAAAGPDRQSEAVAKALDAAGRLALLQDDYAAMLPRLQESVALWRELGDKRGLAYALTDLGTARAYQSRDPEAGGASMIEEAVSLFEETGDKWGLAFALDLLGDALVLQGSTMAEIVQYKERSLALYRQLGDTWGTSSLLSELGNIAAHLGQYDLARTRLEEALSMARGVRDRWYMASIERGLGDVAWHQGDHARAREMYQESLSLYRQVGDRLREANAVRNLAHLAHNSGDFEEAERLYRQSIALVRALGNEQTMALCISGLASAIGARGKHAEAAGLLGCADAVREASHGMMPPADLQQYNYTLDALRALMGEEALAKAMAEGRSNTLEDVFALLDGLSI